MNYTVDFHYEINGKTYVFSIPGSGFVSLEHVVEMLGIASVDENTEKEANNDKNGAENGDDSAGEVPGVDVSGKNEEGSANATADGETIPSKDSTAYEEAINMNEVEVSEATRKFVADVESVEFSSPELVWVGKVESENTVGEIKEEHGLDIQYSVELPKELIAEMDSHEVAAADWVLISILPFDTVETLTVTMTNGEVWEISVTDANANAVRLR